MHGLLGRQGVFIYLFLEHVLKINFESWGREVHRTGLEGQDWRDREHDLEARSPGLLSRVLVEQWEGRA